MNERESEILKNFSNDIREDLSFALKFISESAVTVIVELNGSITTYNAAYFQEKMNSLVDYGYTTLVFTMSRTKYVSAIGIGSFVHISERVKQYGGYIVLEQMQPQVLEVFQLPGFDHYFTVDETISSVRTGIGLKKYNGSREFRRF